MQFSDTDKRSNRKKDIHLRSCIVCGNIIPRNTKAGENRVGIEQYKKAKFCSLKCKGEWQKENNTGENNPNYRGGKTKCSVCGKELDYRYSYRDTLYCKECWYKFYRGDKCNLWKG